MLPVARESRCSWCSGRDGVCVCVGGGARPPSLTGGQAASRLLY